MAKVTFKGNERIIEILPGVVEINVQIDLYSDWKEWQIGTTGDGNTGNRQFAKAFRTFGGDPTIPGQNAPKFFFLQNGWRVSVDNGEVITFASNLYTDNDDGIIFNVGPGSGVSNSNSDAAGISQVAADTAAVLAQILAHRAEVEPELDQIQIDINEHRTETEDRIKTILGLSQSNYRVFNTVHNGDGCLTSSTVRIYENASDLNLDINHLNEYQMTATWTGTLMTDYKMVEV